MIPYIISSFRGGVSDESDKGIAGSYKYGHALDIHKRDDTLTAEQAMQTVEETMTDMVNFFVPASDGTTYCFGSTGSIWARASGTDNAWNFVYGDENGRITGAAEWKLSDGNNYLFWATATSIARVLMNGSLPVPWGAGVAAQNYKTTLESAGDTDWHTMENASGNLMIVNGNYVATIDYIGNFNASAMNVRPGNILKCIEERDDYAVFGSTRKDQSEKGHIWSWTISADNYVQKKKIPVKGVNVLLYTELPLLQGGNNGELFLSDFVNATPLAVLPDGAGQVNPGGATIDNDLGAFGFYGTSYPGIWRYGRRMKNRPHVLDYGYRLAKSVAGSSVGTIGAVAMINGELLTSWVTQDGSTLDYGVDSSSSTTKANAVYEGLEFTNNSPDSTKYIDSVKLITSPMPASTSVAVKYKMNKATAGGDSSANAGFKYAVTGSGATTFGITDATEAEFKVSQEGRVYEVGVELFPSSNNSPEVLCIVTYFNEQTKNHG